MEVTLLQTEHTLPDASHHFGLIQTNVLKGFHADWLPHERSVM